MTLQNTLTGDENMKDDPQDTAEKAQALLKLLESKGISLEWLETALVQGRLDHLHAEKREEMKQVLNPDAELQSALKEVCRSARFFRRGNIHQFILGISPGSSLKKTLVTQYGIQYCNYTSRQLFNMTQEKNSPFRLELYVADNRMAMPEYAGSPGFLLTADDQLFIVDRTADSVTIHCDVKSLDYKA